MKRILFSAVAALTLSAGGALAADLPVKAVPVVAPPPPAWDIAFGAAIASDYRFRGISQSDRKPYSPMGGNGELPNGRVGRSRSGERGPGMRGSGPIPCPFVLNSYLPSAGAPVSHGMTRRPTPRNVLSAPRYFEGIAPG